MRRVVVTGLGTVNPMGSGIETSWENILAGKSGASKITKFKTDDLPSKIACQVPRGTGKGEFDPSQTMDAKDQRKFDEFIVFASAAADEAIADSGWKPTDDEDCFRTGVLIGSGIGGLNLIDACSAQLEERGPRRISPFFIPGALINMASGVVSIRYGFRGPNHAVVTACSTGAHAIGDAARMIAYDDADVMIAGGTEATVNRLALAGFAACRALSTNFNDEPERASRPYDKDRDGFVLGEGAGVVVLEEYEHAKKRGAKIYGEVIGYGLSGDAHHITAPSPDGDGAYRCMTAALKRAKIAPSEIDYVNAHGTSTMADEIELGAVSRVVGNDLERLTMSSTKSATGHLLGAAGAVEAIFSLLAMRDQVAPPTINLDNPSLDTPIDLVPHTAREKSIDVVLSNSFGFGGTNASLVFRRV
ncbi:beta-ketoacyl-[acyl-carrier-protein] synthase II [Acuticoccus sediminis]|uniref:3-oxoacyl-[acyl-carrier-protein] synthase 2 n=1 Tax=Acuticoccus sediminis TaxID=2184697 RepID=A0A8B2NPS2_9HYPH|nr:beta-ketoacyl-ACP synthase II [Acuticoccus sediminis]RAH98920.1 beta-ketoacyl-[acyl-carrier-protein] synthase II [Acuticoccus sediminis]